MFAFHTSCQNANSKIIFDLETREDWSNRILELVIREFADYSELTLNKLRLQKYSDQTHGIFFVA